jgi:hypothetical protein
LWAPIIDSWLGQENYAEYGSASDL